ncbi:MAG TPA: mannitol dehydrogenase family protein, partial [Microvirga sp.]|nr:mannitol dehydrogenase family protein [Microvirga sp.]
MAHSLSLANLASVPASVGRPRYTRAELRAGILHVGVGNFHRSHQALYLDDLFSRGKDHDWALLGAGVRAADAAMRQDLLEQDWLTTVVEMEPGAHRARV